MECVPAEAPAGRQPGRRTLHPVPSGPLRSGWVSEVVGKGPDKGRVMCRCPAPFSLGSERSTRSGSASRKVKLHFLSNPRPSGGEVSRPPPTAQKPRPVTCSGLPASCVTKAQACAGTSVSSDPRALTRSRSHGAAFTPNSTGQTGWGHRFPPPRVQALREATPACAAGPCRPRLRSEAAAGACRIRCCVRTACSPNAARSAATSEGQSGRGPWKPTVLRGAPAPPWAAGHPGACSGLRSSPGLCSPVRSRASACRSSGCPPDVSLHTRPARQAQMLPEIDPNQPSAFPPPSPTSFSGMRPPGAGRSSTWQGHQTRDVRGHTTQHETEMHLYKWP